MQRRRFNHFDPPELRLYKEARLLREQVELLPFGAVRDAAISKAQAETGSQFSLWLQSPWLRRPQ